MSTSPYADSARGYFAAGWAPLPIRGKWPPPTGYTGNDGAWPSMADVLSWEDDLGHYNVGLRLPAHVIGIDVDTYGGKSGAATLSAAEQKWGALPPTWVTTSRIDGSGIRLFSIPEGMQWPGELPGGGVEIIRAGHRYAMCWPSVHPETGATYEWINPRGKVFPPVALPDPDDLPALPQAWVDGLTRGRTAVDLARAEIADSEAMVWIGTHGVGTPCAAMLRAVARACADMQAGSSRHEAASRGTCRIAHLVQEGHVGGAEAIGKLRAAFGDATGHAAARRGEFDRMIAGAVRLAVAVGNVLDGDPCGSIWYSGEVAPRALPTPGAAASPPAAPVTTLATVTPLPEHAPAALPDADPAHDVALAIEIAQQRVRRDAKRFLDDEEAGKRFTMPPSATLTEELSMPDDVESFRVDEVMPTGSNVLLTAQYKTGKTTLINNLVRSLVDADDFLGQYGINPLGPGERVGVFNYEVGRSQYRRWLRDVGVINTDAVAVMSLRGVTMPITTPHVADLIVSWLIEHTIKVWVLDPFARAYTGPDENDNAAVGRWLDALDEIKARGGAQELVLATHTGRAEQEVGKERARGATRLDDWTDVRWLLTKDDKAARYFRASGRDVDTEERVLQFDEATRRLSLGVGNRKDNQDTVIKSNIIAAVERTPGISQNGIIAEVHGTDGHVRQLIKDLVREGHLRTEPGGGKTLKHYRSKPPIWDGVA